MNDGDREQSTLKLVSCEVAIHDLRPMADRLALETNGFVLVRRATQISEFSDPEAVRRDFYPECEALVQALTGADKVVAFGHVQRDGSRQTGHLPVYNAHVDYDVPTIRAVAGRLLQADELQRRLAGRIVLINVWRPLEEVESAPLALCDAASVAREDLVYGPIGGKSAAGAPNAAGYNLTHSPRHRWAYAPKMHPDEALVFKLCDTDEERVQWTAHSSFEDPSSLPDARPRRSIELRTLAFFDV